MLNPPGLTTTKAPFIEQAVANGQLYIEQPYELYSEENHETWRRLFARIRSGWEKYATPKFLEGVEKLAIDPTRVPRLEDINKFLEPLTQFKARAVSGYVPMYEFMESLANREFPTTITIRDGSKIDYLPEPDIFHDVSGHVPMHTDRRFADVLVRYGQLARIAEQRLMDIPDEEKRYKSIDSVIKAMARFFWFTIEFGLMRSNKGLKVYGSGLLSSFGEMQYAIESPEVQRYPFQFEWVVNQAFAIDRYQPLLFIVDSFDQLYDELDRLEQWILDGKLNNVAPGEPDVNETDLKSFLERHVHAEA